MKNIVGNHSKLNVVAEANSGREGKVAIEYYRPDLIILDIVMPSDDGLKVIKHIQEECGVYNPFVYVITAMDTPTIHKILIELEVDFFGFKPIDEQKVIRVLEHVSLAEPKPLNKPMLSKQKNPADIIEDILDELQVPSHLLGAEYIKTALLLMLDNPTLKRKVYSKVAIYYGCNPRAAAANINSALKACMCSEMYRIEFGNEKTETLLFLNRLSAIVKKRMRGVVRIDSGFSKSDS